MSQQSRIIRLDVPDDFPLAPLEQFHAAVQSYWQSNNTEWGQWARACNGLHCRFLACVDADEAFRTSIQDAGASPPPAERTRQEMALFAFFSSGLSALECLGYGLYFVGAIVEPTGFTRPRDQIWFRDVVGAYQARFPSDRLTQELFVVNGSAALTEWRRARNVLTHREAHGRHHFVGTADALSTATSSSVQGVDWRGEPLSAATTFDRRVWLATSVATILDGANDFAADHL